MKVMYRGKPKADMLCKKQFNQLTGRLDGINSQCWRQLIGKGRCALKSVRCRNSTRGASDRRGSSEDSLALPGEFLKWL